MSEESISSVDNAAMRWNNNWGSTSMISSLVLKLESEEIYGMWWSGASDDDKEGKFKWTHSNLELVYLNWGSSEPNGGPTENCVSMTSAGTWETTKCELLFPYVCERGQ
uniref:C-type mannose receptor 2-like n=1 Tax=Crassostrea virginica TaxID=6565 RepID=A0A8B8BXD8_CRAVI|nr:C-type mannose receptor 2-like [Crassostrea virginica]